MERKSLIVANWKMNLGPREAKEFMLRFKEIVGEVSSDVVICPSYICLSDVKGLSEGTAFRVGAQDIHYEDKGAYTSKISAEMVKELCEYVIVGHSERRSCFNDNDNVINKKVKKALEHGLKVIFCLGECDGESFETVEKQLRDGLKDLSSEEMNNVIVAYEPVWAIGTGKSADAEYAQGMHSKIRMKVREIFGEVSERVRVLYGGSVKGENVREYLSKEDIDGVLVGGASLNADSFAEIVRR